MIRKLTCINCPLGCKLEVCIEEEKITVKGNTCSRGEQYGISECTNPVRVLTTTILCEDGSVLSCKSDRPILKEHLFDCLNCINKEVVSLPVTIGDVLMKDIYGVNIVATMNKEKKND